MAWTKCSSVPNPLFDASGTPASGYVLKMYLPGTTTVAPNGIATDNTGGTTATTFTTNVEGKWEVSGNEVVPHIDRKIKWGIFATAADATANTPFYMGPFDNVDQSIAEVTSTGSSTAVGDVDTLSALRALTGMSANDAVILLGHTTVGDGGGGTFYYVSGAAASTYTDDNGITIVPAGGDGSAAWIRDYKSEQGAMFSWYGAKGDGTTDDTASIQSCLDNNSLCRGGAGNYLVSGTYGLRLNTNNKIVGEGKHLTRIFCAENSNINLISCATISNVSGEYDQDIEIRDLELDHNRTSDFTAATLMTLLLVGTRNVVVDDVIFTNPNTDSFYVNYEYGGTGHADNQPSNITVNQCTFNGDNKNRNGISIISGTDYKFTNCTFIKMCKDIGTVAAIDLEPSDTDGVIEGVIIDNCYFNLCRVSIASDYVPDNSNTQVRNVEISNIIVNSSSPHTTTVPSEFVGHGGIQLAHARGVTLDNINIKDTAHAPLFLQDVDNVSMNNLRLVSPTAGVIFRDCTDLNMSNFYIECTNSTTFTSVVTNGLYMIYETTGVGHPGVRRAKFSNGTINNTDSVTTTSSAILGLGNIQDISVKDVHLMGNWNTGIVQANGSSGDALRWTVDATIEDGNSMTPVSLQFDGAITESGNGRWNIPGVTEGIQSFSSSTAEVVTVGDFAKLATAVMSISSVDNPGTIGISAKRSSATAFTITASSAFTGDVFWRIEHP